MRQRSAFSIPVKTPPRDGGGVTVTVDELALLRADAARFFSTAPDAVAGLFPGLYRSLIRGRGLEFEEVRHYQPGDDYRVIDWRVTARTGHLYTKVFREERERTVLLGLDASKSMRFGTRRAFLWVAAAQALGLLAWMAADNHDRVGGIVIGGGKGIGETRPILGAAGALRLFRLWEESGQRHAETAGEGLLEGLLRLRHHARHGALVVLASDFREWNDEIQRLTAGLARRNGVVLLQLFDPIKSGLPEAGWLGFSDGEKVLAVDTRNDASRERVHRDFAARAAAPQRFCADHTIRFLQINNQLTPPESLHRAVKRAAVPA